MHITLIIKKPSKENLLELPQTWTALIRTQSLLVGFQDQGLWGNMSHFCPFAKTLVRWGKNFYTLLSPLKLEKNSEFWSLVYGHLYHHTVLWLQTLIWCFPLVGLMLQFRSEIILFSFSKGDFHPSSCHSSPPCSLEQAFSTAVCNDAPLISTCASLAFSRWHLWAKLSLRIKVVLQNSCNSVTWNRGKTTVNRSTENIANTYFIARL